ncbi:hypothetical protein Q7P37_006905 [Cladosporium fusiforme]
MATLSSSFPTFTFPNASTTTAAPTCAPCSWLMIEPGYATWTAANSSLPALRTTQLYFDPNHNTTSTSVSCNSAALSAYTPIDNYWVNDDCELVAKYLAFAVGDDWMWETVTLTETTGSSLRVGGLMSGGPVTTSNEEDGSTCIQQWQTRFPTMMTYTDPITQTVSLSGTFWLMPDLSKYFPGVAAVEQCTQIIPGGSPVALTPANEIKLPVITLDWTSTSDASTSKTASSRSSTRTSAEETTTARPGGSSNTIIPTRTSAAQPTSTSERADDSSSLPNSQSTVVQDPPSSSAVEQNPGNEETSRDTHTTTQKDSSSPNSPEPVGQSEGNQLPASEGPSATPSQNQRPPSANPSDENAEAPSAVLPAQTASKPAQQSDSDPSPTKNQQNNSPIRPADQDGAADTDREQPETQPLASQTERVDAQPTGADSDSTDEQSAPLSRTLPAINTAQPDVFLTQSGSELVFGSSTTIRAGGDPAVSDGTTFSVLPSSRGVIAIANGASRTIAADSFTPVAPSSQAYVVDDVQFTAGGAAATISGTTFSALPSGSGVLVVADGQSNTVTGTPVAEAPRVFGTPSSHAYIVAEVQFTAGGAAVTISGTTFSALPSGSGVLVVAGRESSTVTGSALGDYAVSAVAVNSAENRFPQQSLTPGGPAVTIQGTTYSALPGQSGILVEASGSSTTVDAAEATNIPTLDSFSAVESISDGYILDGRVTLTISGAATTFSGTVYTALPSGAGVLAVAAAADDEDEDDKDAFAPFIEQGISGGDSETHEEAKIYVIWGNITIAAGDLAVTVSGTVFSALPSGSGVIAVADGRTTTQVPSTTRQSADAGATGSSDGDDEDDDVVAVWTGSGVSMAGSVGLRTVVVLQASVVLLHFAGVI